MRDAHKEVSRFRLLRTESAKAISESRGIAFFIRRHHEVGLKDACEAYGSRTRESVSIKDADGTCGSVNQKKLSTETGVPGRIESSQAYRSP